MAFGREGCRDTVSLVKKTIRLSLAALACVAPLALVACNNLTGVNDLEVSGSGDTKGATSGGGGQGQGGAGAGGEQTGAGAGPVTIPMVAAKGVSIREVALYQGVKRPLAQNGSPAPGTIPVVEGRPALLRVFVDTDGGYDQSPVTANLYLGSGSAPLVVTKTINGPSNDAALGSTINFDLPAEVMTGGLNYRVELQQPADHSDGNNPAASYPASGTDAINVQSNGQKLRIKIVPVSYQADGSGRLPDTSPSQLKAYEDLFFGMYPVREVEITVRQPMNWSYDVESYGNGWGELLDAVANLRQQDGAPSDVYYYGAFSPASSPNQYCGGGCVAGLGMIGSAQDSYTRAAIGLGWTGDMATETAVHEVGHNHGREHAPCGGAQGVDPGYPYAGAKIGVWGYDLVSKTLLNPNSTTDMMGYCSSIWVSDYTFKALFSRVKSVNKAKVMVAPELLDRVYDRARVDGEGNLTWLSSEQIHEPPMGEPTLATIATAVGSAAVEAQYFPYDHLPGGVLVWPRGAALTTGIAISLRGKLLAASR